MIPPSLPFTAAERRLIRRLHTPEAVQRFLNQLPYNTEPPPDPATLRSFRGVMRTHTTHCLEAALAAAVILEQHRYPPLVMSLESVDELDHVVFVYQSGAFWGSVGRSRDPGLHGLKPLFRSPRHLALSYFDPYIDATGCVKGYAVADLRDLGPYDWRLSPRNVWKAERFLLEFPHRPIRSSAKRVARLRARYLAFRRDHHGRKPLYYDRRRWTEIPGEFKEVRVAF